MSKPSKWPWTTMEVGDSFVMTGVKNTTARGAASAASKRHGKKFKTAQEPEGVRITRAA
jgi:hypothetical protein